MFRDSVLRGMTTAVFTLLVAASAQGQTTWYVDDDAPLGGNGQTWATAYTYLQDALARCRSGNQVRVAAGTYRPDQDEAGNVTLLDQHATFQLVNGVALRGGYRGCPGGSCSGDPNERDIEFYESVLSGDLAGNDVAVASPNLLRAEPTRSENAVHVVTCSGASETTLLDGFFVIRGNASGSGERGGGMYNRDGSPTLMDCVFLENSARWGGGMYSYAGAPALVNCRFLGNASSVGGGLYNNSGAATLTECTFSENSASEGGGMWNRYGDPTLTDCNFSANSAVGKGGGMYTHMGDATISGCEFLGNSASGGGGCATAPVARP